MNDSRPINLRLDTLRFPVTAIISILHRVSGLLLAILLPFLLWGLDASLSSQHSFDAMQHCLASFWVKLIIWGFLAAMSYHVIAGIRHLLMDMGIGESLCGGRFSAKLVLACSIIVTALLGIWIW